MTTDDLLARAEALDNSDPKMCEFCESNDCELCQDLIGLLPDLIAEVKRLKSFADDLMGNCNSLRSRAQKAEATCSRLEAAYLREARIRMAAENRYTEPSDWEDEARMCLEQIKRGEQG